MSKKKFIEGLESLLMEESDVSFSKESPYLSKKSGQQESASQPAPQKEKKKSSGKNFSSDLSSIFQEAVTDSIEEHLDQRKSAKKSPARRKRRSPRPMDGLDSLIRKTIESGELEVTYGQRKRLTLTLEKEKIAKLKEIAKVEKSYLRDVVSRIVGEFINEYEEKKGKA